MTETEFAIYALIAGVVVSILFYWDYRRSHCTYGGADTGHNNWQDVDLPEEDDVEDR